MKSINYAILFLSIIMIGILGCSSGKNVSDKSNKHDANQLNIGLIRIPPGVVRIRRTMVDIDSSRKFSMVNSPYSKQPCWAHVKINSILGYGAGAPVVSESDTVFVKFGFTLGPTTKKLFPNLVHRLPGLPIGSSFQADLRIFNSKILNNKKSEVTFQINLYKKF